MPAKILEIYDLIAKKLPQLQYPIPAFPDKCQYFLFRILFQVGQNFRNAPETCKTRIFGAGSLGKNA
jgi:hypothetical protein